MNTNDKSNTRGRAFRRVSGAVIVTGAAACAAVALFGSLPAQATVTHHARGTAALSTEVVAKTEQVTPESVAQARTPEEKIALVKELQKQAANDPQQKNLDAYYAAGYKYEDALDLAALWNSTDRNQAKAAAGAKLSAGHALPFTPGQGFHRSYTKAQQLRAYEIAEVNDAGLADRLAQHWNVSKTDAKAKAGALALANQPVPLQHPTPTEGEAGEAFFDAGYDAADAKQLAQIWKLDPYSAKIKAGQDLLSSPQIPLPIKP